VIFWVVAHHFVRDNKRSNNSRYKQKDDDSEHYHMRIDLD
jgi:hypothetical protein